MKKGVFKDLWLAAAALMLSACSCFGAEIDGECSIFSNAVIDSVRREYYEPAFSQDSITPSYIKKQYDKSFIGITTNLDFRLKGDINDRSYIDLEENLYWRHYNEEEPLGLAYGSYRYGETDHCVKAELGIAAGDKDLLQLRLYNTALIIDAFDVMNSRTNKGEAVFTHSLGDNTSLAVTGFAEETLYENDEMFDFRESGVRVDFAGRTGRKKRYVHISNAKTGDPEFFSNLPGLKAERVNAYFTDFVDNPEDSDPKAKYRLAEGSGEFIYNVFGTFRKGEYKNMVNEYDEASGGFAVAAEASDDVTLRLSELYTKRDYSLQSIANWLYDSTSNKVDLAVEHELSDAAAQTLSCAFEQVNYSGDHAKSYKQNSLNYEGVYEYGRISGGVALGTARRRYDAPAAYFPDENENRYSAQYGYMLSNTVQFRAAGEYTESEYLCFENDLFSNYSRKSYRAGIKKTFSESCDAEFAFQKNIEEHDTYTQNNVDESIVGVNFSANF